uniref:General transcription factor IIH subunit 3 n=1 Tax=Heterorhabditis bacteriophora TaxID=37862 RepID=A0A1I7X7F6_HETBA
MALDTADETSGTTPAVVSHETVNKKFPCAGQLWNNGFFQQHLGSCCFENSRSDSLLCNMSSLSLVVECSSCSWGKMASKHGEQAINDIIRAMLKVSFSNSHLSLSASNRLLLFAFANKIRKKLLFNSRRGSPDSSKAMVNALRETLRESALSDDTKMASPLAAVLSQAICHMKRNEGSEIPCTSTETTISQRGRVIIVSMTSEFGMEHGPLMNLFFSSAKHGIYVDVISLDEPSPLLQQAADITGGLFIQVDSPKRLLSYMMTHVLTDPTSRSLFPQLALKAVDYRASCVCHHQLVSSGWVCSVCLSVLCQFTPMVAPEGDEQSPEVHLLWEHGRRMLFDALDSLEGEKTIVWDRSVMHRVNLFAGPSVLKTHGVVCNSALDQFRPPETPHVIFFLSPSLNALDGLCDYIEKSRNDTKILYQVFFIPEAWYVVREKLKERENGRYWERLESVKELPLSWLPHDGDCLSLAEPQLPSRLLINGDWTYLHRCAVALNQLISLCSSRIPIYSRGKWSHDVARMVNKMEPSTESSSSSTSLILNRIIIIDRWLDPLTPMLTQLTYSGLLDETYTVGIVGSIKARGWH